MPQYATIHCYNYNTTSFPGLVQIANAVQHLHLGSCGFGCCWPCRSRRSEPGCLRSPAGVVRWVQGLGLGPKNEALGLGGVDSGLPGLGVKALHGCPSFATMNQRCIEKACPDPTPGRTAWHLGNKAQIMTHVQMDDAARFGACWDRGARVQTPQFPWACQSVDTLQEGGVIDEDVVDLQAQACHAMLLGLG